MLNLSKSALVKFLSEDFKGCSSACITYKNVIEHNKKSKITGATWNETFGGLEVIKTSMINTLVGSAYEKMVNNERSREGVDEKFAGESLPYGEWVVPNTLLRNNKTGEFQLRGYLDSTMTSTNDKVVYTWTDGRPVTKEDWTVIEEFVSKRSDSGKQMVEKTVKPRMYLLSKIESCRIGGRVFN
jgi:hypothetical protein